MNSKKSKASAGAATNTALRPGLIPEVKRENTIGKFAGMSARPTAGFRKREHPRQRPRRCREQGCRGRLSSQRARLIRAEAKPAKPRKEQRALPAQRVFESMSERENCSSRTTSSPAQDKGALAHRAGSGKKSRPRTTPKRAARPGKPKRMLASRRPAQISATAHHHFRKADREALA